MWVRTAEDTAPVWGPLSCFGAFGLFWGGWGALLPAVKNEAGATDGQLGVALLLLAAAALPAMLSAGRLVDRFGERTLAPATAAFAAAALLPGLVDSLWALYGSALLIGAASGTLDVAMNAAVATNEVRSGRRLMHLAHAVFSASVVVAAVVVGLGRSAGAEPELLSGVIAAAVLLVAASVWRTGRARAVDAGNEEPPLAGGPRLRFSGPLLGLGALCALAYLVENALQSWSALHLERTLGAGPAVGGLGPALFAAAAASGRLGAQTVAGRVADRRLLAAAAALGGAGTGVTAVAPSQAVALIGIVIAGAGISVAAPTLFSLAGRLVGAAERGTAMATVTTIGYLGFLLGPAVVGAVAAASDLRVALAVVAGAALVLAGLARYAAQPP